MRENSNNENILNKTISTLGDIFGCIGRTTVRYVRNIPNKTVNYAKRKINEYKRRPPREDINKVYVLVGYTTKAHIDARYNAERFMIILRKGLLLLIFVLILLISIKAVLPYVNIAQYQHMFGIEDVDELTQNDPFANPGMTGPAVNVVETTSADDTSDATDIESVTEEGGSEESDGSSE